MHKLLRTLATAGASMLIAVSLLSATPTEAGAAESRVVCNYDWVRVREKATTGSRELARLPRGTAITGTRQGSWFRLSDGRYVAAYYTCAGGAARPTAASGASFSVCRTPWVRVRAAATTASRETGRLTRGTVFSGKRTGSWVRRDDGGFVAASYTCAASAPSAPSAPAASASAPVAVELAAVKDVGTPLLQPTGTRGARTGPFGNRLHPILNRWQLHNGIDIGNRAGEPVVAAEAGVVTTVSRDATAGLYVKIQHGSLRGVANVRTNYLHLREAVVRPGDRVSRGQLIGRTGNTGLSTKPHLHFSVFENGLPVNPERWIGPLGSLRV